MKIKQFYNSKKTFLNIFLTIMFSILLTTLILSSILYINFEKISLNFINTSNLHVLSQISNSLNYIDTTAKDFGISTLINNDVKTLLYGNGEDMFQISNSFRKVHRIAASIPYLHSLYLYNSTIDCYYSTFLSPTNSKNSFFDKEIISIMDEPFNKQTRLLPRKIPTELVDNTVYENVYTYIFYDKALTGSAKNDAVIVNVKANWLTCEINSLNTFDKLNGSKENMVFIINNEGKIVNHPDEKMFSKDVSNESYIRKILSLKTDKLGYFIDDVDSQKSIISFISSSTIPNWTFISITPYETIASQLLEIKRTTFIIFLSILLLGLIISFVFFKFAYSPINKLVLDIRGLVHNSDTYEKGIDEISFISHSFSKTIEKANSLEDYKRNSFNLVRQEILRDTVLNSPISIAEIASKFKRFDIKLIPDGEMYLIVLRIDSYHQFLKKFNEKDSNLMIFAIQNISNEFLSNYFTCESFYIPSTDHIVLLVNIPDRVDNYSNIKEKLISTIKQIQSACMKHLDFSVSSSISSLSPDIMKINSLYIETLNFSNYRVLYGHNCIITADKMKQITFNQFNYPFEKQDVLINNLKTGKKEQVEEKFNEIALIISKFSYSNIMLSYTILASNIFNTLKLIESNSMISFELDFYSFNKEINNMDTMSNINTQFYELFEYINTKMNYTKDKKVELIVENIIKIINNNYMDINLSLGSIADMLKMSPNHFGKIFREHTSHTIPDYITNTRLEKARSLLINSSYNINDIADKIGFCSSKYLFKVFKKKFGVTPGEFRLKNNIVNS